MSRPFLLAQISDPHLGEAPRDGSDPEECLRAVVKALFTDFRRSEMMSMLLSRDTRLCWRM